MKIWNPFRRKAPSETKSLASPEDWLSGLFGSVPSTTGLSISAASALRVPAVNSAVRIISEAAASLDVQVKEVAGDGTETDAANHPVLPLLRDQANDWTSGYELIRDLVIDALTRDTGGLAFVNRPSGTPVEVVRYSPGVIAVDYEQNTGEPSYKIDNVAVSSQNIIHVRPPMGKAPLTLACEAIAVAAVMERHAARLFSNGARPSGALMFPKNMGEDAVKAARAAWKSTHEGENTTGATAILYDGTEFKPFAFASTDAQFLENRKFQILEIARHFRVPPSMLYELDRATWSNTEQMGREFLSYTLEPWLQLLEGALRQALFLPEDRARYAIRFDRDDLTRADLTTRATAINSLRASKIINANEGRNWLGLPPRDGGETFENPNINTNDSEDTGGSD